MIPVNDALNRILSTIITLDPVQMDVDKSIGIILYNNYNFKSLIIVSINLSSYKHKISQHYIYVCGCI